MSRRLDNYIAIRLPIHLRYNHKSILLQLKIPFSSLCCILAGNWLLIMISHSDYPCKNFPFRQSSNWRLCRSFVFTISSLGGDSKASFTFIRLRSRIKKGPTMPLGISFFLEKRRLIKASNNRFRMLAVHRVPVTFMQIRCFDPKDFVQGTGRKHCFS